MSSPTVLMILGAISHRTDFLNSELFLKNGLEMVLEISESNSLGLKLVGPEE